MAKGQFSEAVVVVDKTWKRSHVYFFGTWIVILEFYMWLVT